MKHLPDFFSFLLLLSPVHALFLSSHMWEGLPPTCALLSVSPRHCPVSPTTMLPAIKEVKYSWLRGNPICPLLYVLKQIAYRRADTFHSLTKPETTEIHVYQLWWEWWCASIKTKRQQEVTVLSAYLILMILFDVQRDQYLFLHLQWNKFIPFWTPWQPLFWMLMGVLKLRCQLRNVSDRDTSHPCLWLKVPGF